MIFALATMSCVAPVQTGSAAGSRMSPRPTAALLATRNDYERLEAEVITELNAARAHPSAYASNLEELIPSFHDKLLDRPGWPMAIRTQEGASAVRDGINALQSQPAVGAVMGVPALSDAARDLATLQRDGALGHTGPDKSTPGSRISAHGTWGRTYNENIAYGRFPTGRDVVVDLIVDDGVPDRGHRTNIFNPNVHFVGVGCGPHRVYGMVCVIDQAGTFTPK
jgi:uncharacterized protein YkwD